MNLERNGATAPTMAQSQSTRIFYYGTSRSASRINDVLARLLFGLERPYLSPVERMGVLTVVDQPLRLKIDLGPLKGVGHDA